MHETLAVSFTPHMRRTGRIGDALGATGGTSIASRRRYSKKKDTSDAKTSPTCVVSELLKRIGHAARPKVHQAVEFEISLAGLSQCVI